MSLKLVSFGSEATAKELETPWTKSSLVRSLSEHARTCGPYKVRDWATRRSLTIHYVDNCWVRVPVTAEHAREFLRHLAGSGEDLPPPDDGEIYVIEAEEF